MKKSYSLLLNEFIREIYYQIEESKSSDDLLNMLKLKGLLQKLLAIKDGTL